jgi:NADH:ubiquinone oxidoreductase subunit F (NADH-binding)/NADH:ubiquinone oxidoreductase subunit E
MPSYRMSLRTPDPEIAEIVDSIERDPERVLEAFQALQQRHFGLTTEMIDDVAHGLNIPPAKAYGVATFYSMLSVPPDDQPELAVCDGVVCWLSGSQELTRQAAEHGWTVRRSSCLGLCDCAPAAYFDGNQIGPIRDISNVLPPRVQDSPEHRRVFTPRDGEERQLLANIEDIDPTSVNSALDHGAYDGIRKILFDRDSPNSVLDQVHRSGVLGRGGAGFPAGRKWHAAAAEPRVPKYVLCNADESEPLTFKDRILIETNPHQLLEGMIICGYAIGSSEGYIYIRGEYEPQARLLERAIRQAEELELLGSNILGTDFSFHIHVHRGAGAYICGEASAMISSLEGKRGLPRFKPPRTTTSGFRQCPTVVNNVETFTAASWVVRNGVETYLSSGDPDYPGTKLFGVMGKVNDPGLFEAPYRITLRQIIDQFGGGMPEGSRFHFALTGGAAGTIVGPEKLDVPLDFTSGSYGIMLGAGGFMICDQNDSPLNVLRELAFFFERESCGKCTPCRIGTVKLREMLDRIIESGPMNGDISTLKALAVTLRRDSFCALGQSVADPLESALASFPELFQPEAVN